MTPLPEWESTSTPWLSEKKTHTATRVLGDFLRGKLNAIDCWWCATDKCVYDSCSGPQQSCHKSYKDELMITKIWRVTTPDDIFLFLFALYLAYYTDTAHIVDSNEQWYNTALYCAILCCKMTIELNLNLDWKPPTWGDHTVWSDSTQACENQADGTTQTSSHVETTHN